MYKYGDNTLLHSAGVNFSVMESIMKNGIVSEKYGKEHGISVNRSHLGYNLDDTVSCVRYLYVNEEVEDSAYNRYIKNGVSFIIEDVPFIYDKSERVIHRSDEVLVKDYIPKEKITGINFPSYLQDTPLEELEYINVGEPFSFSKNKSIDFPTSCSNIKHIIDNISSYIKEKSNLDRNYDDFYRELYYLNQIVENERESLSKSDLEDIYNEFRDVLVDLNYSIGVDYSDCFKKVLGKEEVTALDVVNYINNKTLNLPIYETETRKQRKGVR